jgi:hypothetical protein
VSDCEAAIDWDAGALRLRKRASHVEWEKKTMRTILALGLLISLSAAANAATVHHHRRHAVASQRTVIDSVPGFAYAPAEQPRAYQPVPYSDQPSPYDNRYPNWGG